MLSDAIKELMDRFPKHGSLTLAKLAYKNNPHIWNSVEQARAMVRYYRKAKGKLMASRLDPKNQRPPGEVTREKPFRASIPKAVPPCRTDPYTPKFTKALVLSDIHVPYHDVAALSAAVDYGLSEGCDCVVLNGDVIDFYAISSFEKDPRERDLAMEVERCREFFTALRGAFPDAEIVYKLGNHERRWTRHLSNNAPDLLGVDDFDLSSVLRASDLGFETLDHMRHVRLGRVNVIHGDEYRGTGGVNPARWLYLKAHDTTICGHFHRTSHHTEKNMSGKLTSCWSLGCLCQFSPGFMRYDNWNHGFAIVDCDTDDGYGRVRNMRIEKGRVVG